jgi:hypothetical protein
VWIGRGWGGGCRGSGSSGRGSSRGVGVLVMVVVGQRLGGVRGSCSWHCCCCVGRKSWVGQGVGGEGEGVVLLVPRGCKVGSRR